VAAQLKQDLGVETDLVVGDSGEFTVWVDGVKVASKDRGMFPEPNAVVTAVRAKQPS
jgi:hypothetical protein